MAPPPICVRGNMVFQGAEYLTLGLQVPPQKAFGPSKPTPNTFETKVLGALGLVSLHVSKHMVMLGGELTSPAVEKNR